MCMKKPTEQKTRRVRTFVRTIPVFLPYVHDIYMPVVIAGQQIIMFDDTQTSDTNK